MTLLRLRQRMSVDHSQPKAPAPEAEKVVGAAAVGGINEVGTACAV